MLRNKVKASVAESNKVFFHSGFVTIRCWLGGSSFLNPGPRWIENITVTLEQRKKALENLFSAANFHFRPKKDTGIIFIHKSLAQTSHMVSLTLREKVQFYLWLGR